MRNTLPKFPSLSVLAVAAAAVGMSAISLSAFQSQAKFSGTWKLNVAASTNPGGPAPAAAPRGGDGGAAAAGGSGGGGGKSGGGKASIGNSGGPPPGGSLGPEEQKRLYAELKVLQAAPKTLGIQAGDKQFDLTYDDGPPAGAVFKHVPDGKKQTLQTKLGKLDQKVSWNGKVFKRETSSAEALTFTEEYSLSDDGKQLTVAISVKSTMERISAALNPTIKRVYDRAQ